VAHSPQNRPKPLAIRGLSEHSPERNLADPGPVNTWHGTRSLASMHGGNHRSRVADEIQKNLTNVSWIHCFVGAGKVRRFYASTTR